MPPRGILKAGIVQNVQAFQLQFCRTCRPVWNDRPLVVAHDLSPAQYFDNQQMGGHRGEVSAEDHRGLRTPNQPLNGSNGCGATCLLFSGSNWAIFG